MGEDAGETDNEDGITAALAKKQESRTECNRRMRSRWWRYIDWVISRNSLTCPTGLAMKDMKDRRGCLRPLKFSVRSLQECCAYHVLRLRRQDLGILDTTRRS